MASRSKSPKKSKLSLTARRRVALVERDGLVCSFCGKDLPESFRGVEVDHFRPRFWGGKDDIANLELLHGRCNNLKGYWWNGDKERTQTHRFTEEGAESHRDFFCGCRAGSVAQKRAGLHVLERTVAEF